MAETARLTAATRGARPAAGASPLGAVVAVCLTIGLADRLLVGWRAPLWLDETFTAVIATQPDLPSLLHWCLNELSGPVYYSLIWAWEKIAGPGDLALRLPSLACSLATPLLVLWRGHPDRRMRWLWAALIAVWVPGLASASAARPYALLLLLATAQAILFLRLMRAPSQRLATGWCAVTAAMLLTHYHAAAIGALQGLAYLAAHGPRAVRTWPAALVFVPVAAWMSVHLPLLLLYAGRDTVWYATLDASAWRWLPAMLFGPDLPSLLLVAVIAATTAVAAARGMPGRIAAGELWLAAAAVAAVLIVFGAGFVRPSFTPRYLLPSMPALLFGVARWVRAMEPRWRHVGAVVLTGFAGAALAPLMEAWRGETADVREIYNFERPSDWLWAQGVRREIFFWDSPVVAITSDAAVREVGGFFHARAGRPVTMIAPHVPRHRDPNPLLEALAARAGPGTGLVWAYDRGVPGTLAATYPPRLAAMDARWRCRDLGQGSIGMLACIR